MGSPLGPALANIYMVTLEQELIPKLTTQMCGWKRYVDDTLAYVKSEEIPNILEELNSYDHRNLFTHEIANDNSFRS